MENFLKPFLEKGIIYSLENVPTDTEGNSDISVIKFIRKIIFKQDVLVEFKVVLNSACSPEPFTVKNDTVKNIIQRLCLFVQSNEDIKNKIEVFCYIFRSFALSCKRDENIPVLQFFIVLSHILTISEISKANKNALTDDCVINAENFINAFDVNISTPSSEFFVIFKELLLCLSNTGISLNASEVQPYYKWLQKLIKNIANFQPFQNVFMEIYTICGEIDFKLLEGNLEDIFCNVLDQKVTDKNFSDFYSTFLEKTLMTCAQFQRTDKFMTKFLTSVKETPTSLIKEIILPPNVVIEFSKVVVAASNQQSLSLMEIFIQSANESFTLISQNDSGLLLLLVSSELLISFFKDVKVFAPNIAYTTLQSFIDKLNILMESLKKFGSFLFNDKLFILKNENIIETFLELCFYCEEIHLLINCYKDSICQPSQVSHSTPDCDWQCCLYLEQWKKLVKFILKSKLESCASISFRLALQKIRACKLEKITFDEDSTIKALVYYLTSDFYKFNAFQQMPPEDLKLLMDALTIKQSKLVIENIFRQALQNDNKAEWMTWFSNSAIQENSVFIMFMFSNILKKTGSYMQDLINDKNNSKTSWLLNDYFDNSNLNNEILDQLPEKINILMKSNRKIRKSIGRNTEKRDSLAKIFEIFKLLPLPYMKDELRRLGLSFAFGIGTLMADDEDIACLVFEAICNFLAFDIDGSTCFDIGLGISCLSELSYENRNVNELKMKVVESLIRHSPKTKFGLNQLGQIVENMDAFKSMSPLKMMETQVILYNELGKCWQRAKKRKSDNDLIGSYRMKLAKVISVEAKEFQEASINEENCKLFFKIIAIELSKAVKSKDETEIANLVAQKFPSYFEFAAKSLKRDFNEAPASFLTVVLQSMPQLRRFLPQDSLLKIWKALKSYEKVNWQLFYNHSSDEEFTEIVDDLLKLSKKFLNSPSDKHSSNCFEIWVSFFELSSGSKKKTLCQLRLQELFNYIHDCSLLLKDLPIKRKISLMQFFSFCVSSKTVMVTSHVLDTIIHCMLECLENSASIEDYHNLFTLEVEVASAILLKQFVWSRSKVHLTFVIFVRILGSLIARCDADQQINKEEVMKLSACAFCMEKWVSLMVKKGKDFARTSPYFITTLISFIASVTVLSAIKIHLTNCINHFLSISDSHTVAYLMRILKPGYQQVFNTMYDQFKKYHKYSGKI